MTARPEIDDSENERGDRASFDPKTGKVSGSGAGAGGNNPSEDYDDDPMAGGGTAAGGPIPAEEAVRDREDQYSGGPR